MSLAKRFPLFYIEAAAWTSDGRLLIAGGRDEQGRFRALDGMNGHRFHLDAIEVIADDLPGHRGRPFLRIPRSVRLIATPVRGQVETRCDAQPPRRK